MPQKSASVDVLDLDLARYELRRGGKKVKLEKIPMELLIFLVEEKDRLVSREEIVERIWGRDVFFDTEQGVNTAVRKIRLALGDDADQPRYLQTVVGKGYRFIGEITVTAGKKKTGTQATASLAPLPERDPEAIRHRLRADTASPF